MSEIEKKICPLTEAYCNKALCAWWISNIGVGKCAIVGIARRMGGE